MIVSSNSWHMKACRKVWGAGYKPENLCKHFWVTTATLSLWLVLASIASGIIGGIGVGLYFLVRAWTMDWTIAAGIILGVLAVAILVIGVGNWLDPKMKEYRRTHPPRVREPKEPNILIQWVRAKKGKYCPMIEVRDAHLS